MRMRRSSIVAYKANAAGGECELLINYRVIMSYVKYLTQGP